MLCENLLRCLLLQMWLTAVRIKRALMEMNRPVALFVLPVWISQRVKTSLIWSEGE